MSNSRYPKLCLLKLIEIANSENRVVKYNWVSLVNKYFLEPINSSYIWNNIALIDNLEFRTALINNFTEYLYNLDLVNYQNSSSLLVFPRIFPLNNAEYFLFHNYSIQFKKFIM